MTSERQSGDDSFDQILRRRNNLIKQYLKMDAEISAAEIRVIDQINRDRQKAKLKEQKHQQDKDLATHQAELEKEVWLFKKRYLRSAELKAKNDNWGTDD